MLPAQAKETDPRFCNCCGAVADLGMTCVGPRCRNCGCDNARPFGGDSDRDLMHHYGDDPHVPVAYYG